MIWLLFFYVARKILGYSSRLCRLVLSVRKVGAAVISEMMPRQIPYLLLGLKGHFVDFIDELNALKTLSSKPLRSIILITNTNFNSPLLTLHVNRCKRVAEQARWVYLPLFS